MADHLQPARHRQGDFFVADILDAAPKDDLGSMEHPLFALKAGDRQVRHYERGGASVTVEPGHGGLATIHDKDVWIYCISQLVAAMNHYREDVGPTVRFTAYDFLVATNRPTSGAGYERMADALERLDSTRLRTNIETGETRERRGFGLVESWRVIERGQDNRMVAVEVTLPDWLYRAVQERQVLTLSRDYFRLRKPIDRRLYELARKHCGAQARWRVGLKTLQEKAGSRAALREFRRAVEALAKADPLPDYRVHYNPKTDAVTFYLRGQRGGRAQVKDATEGRI